MSPARSNSVSDIWAGASRSPRRPAPSTGAREPGRPSPGVAEGPCHGEPGSATRTRPEAVGQHGDRRPPTVRVDIGGVRGGDERLEPGAVDVLANPAGVLSTAQEHVDARAQPGDRI